MTSSLLELAALGSCGFRDMSTGLLVITAYTESGSRNSMHFSLLFGVVNVYLLTADGRIGPVSIRAATFSEPFTATSLLEILANVPGANSSQTVTGIGSKLLFSW